jgi:uncharacterized protein YjdB
MSHRSLAPRFAVTFLSVILASCLADQNAGPDMGLSLRVVSGDAQRGFAGAELPDPLVVQVTDGRGRGVRDQLVNFVVTGGNGTVFAGSAITDRDGVAQEYWTLGTLAGAVNRVEVRAVDPTTGAKQVFAVFTAIVDPSPAATISVTPVTATIVRGGTVQLAAEARDQFGNLITDRAPQWTAFISTVAQVSPEGLVTGVGGGQTYVQARLDDVSDSALVTVLQVGSVVVQPPTLNVDLLQTAQLTATVRATNGALMPDAPVAWLSLNPAIASVSASGLVRGEDGGATKVIASSDGVADTVNVTVAIRVDSVAVSPATATFPAGQTRTFTGQAFDARGRLIARTFSWTSSNQSIVRIVSVSGAVVTVEGVNAGQAEVRATSEGVVGFAVATVTALSGDIFEPNNSSGTAFNLGDVDEGATRLIDATIHTTTDRDWFRVVAREATSACFPGTDQDFRFSVTLSGIPAGRDYDLVVYTDGQPGTFPNRGSSDEGVIWTFDGTCGADDSREFLIEVLWFAGAPSSVPYRITMQFVEQ